MKVLFLCVANSARSQLAQVLAQDIYKKRGLNEAFVQSAGSEPSGKVNPHAIEVLRDLGFTSLLDQLRSNSVDELPADFINSLDFIITLCADEVCPIVETKAQRLHWPYPDPHSKQDFENIAKQLKPRLEEFINEEN